MRLFHKSKNGVFIFMPGKLPLVIFPAEGVKDPAGANRQWQRQTGALFPLKCPYGQPLQLCAAMVGTPAGRTCRDEKKRLKQQRVLMPLPFFIRCFFQKPFFLFDYFVKKWAFYKEKQRQNHRFTLTDGNAAMADSDRQLLTLSAESSLENIQAKSPAPFERSGTEKRSAMFLSRRSYA